MYKQGNGVKEINITDTLPHGAQRLGGKWHVFLWKSIPAVHAGRKELQEKRKEDADDCHFYFTFCQERELDIEKIELGRARDRESLFCFCSFIFEFEQNSQELDVQAGESGPPEHIGSMRILYGSNVRWRSWRNGSESVESKSGGVGG
jgi:hypothetical protein